MKNVIISKLALACLGLLFVMPSVQAFGRMGPAGKPRTPMHRSVTQKDLDLRIAMRQLWVEHAVWTHEYLVFATHDIAADYKALAAKRLLKNQDDIGNAVVPYYGKEAGKKLAALLRDHILIAVEVVDAAKAGKQDALKKADEKWHANAKDIAAFLHKANPENWLEADLVAMLNKHLKLTTDEAVALLKGQWAELVTLYDQVIAQLMMMADDLSKGIVKQFPDKFDYQPMRKMMRTMRTRMHWNKK